MRQGRGPGWTLRAPIGGASAPRGSSLAPARQALYQHYHRALKAAGGIEIIKGFHSLIITTGVLVDPIADIRPGTRCRIQDWTRESVRATDLASSQVPDRLLDHPARSSALSDPTTGPG